MFGVFQLSEMGSYLPAITNRQITSTSLTSLVCVLSGFAGFFSKAVDHIVTCLVHTANQALGM